MSAKLAAYHMTIQKKHLYTLGFLYICLLFEFKTDVTASNPTVIAMSINH